MPLNVSEVFYFAQKAVLHPTAPLYDSRDHVSPSLFQFHHKLTKVLGSEASMRKCAAANIQTMRYQQGRYSRSRRAERVSGTLLFLWCFPHIDSLLYSESVLIPHCNFRSLKASRRWSAKTYQVVFGMMV